MITSTSTSSTSSPCPSALPRQGCEFTHSSSHSLRTTSTHLGSQGNMYQFLKWIAHPFIFIVALETPEIIHQRLARTKLGPPSYPWMQLMQTQQQSHSLTHVEKQTSLKLWYFARRKQKHWISKLSCHSALNQRQRCFHHLQHHHHLPCQSQKTRRKRSDLLSKNNKFMGMLPPTEPLFSLRHALQPLKEINKEIQEVGNKVKRKRNRPQRRFLDIVNRREKIGCLPRATNQQANPLLFPGCCMQQRRRQRWYCC
ncbi:hypothetical protein BD289DRAFT_159237 [Coniella lustricola]|uniref:Uncharacterized protein n=1 Tax=Coniella lustricola TaxID=2025994 RepID=A0A2T3AEM0_9PEZI|nr:hypothetical protein BD289DRAFT_159237 [Coniella lustricola]